MEANVRAVLVTALAPVAWGSTYWVTRHVLPADLPLLGAAIRALPAGLVLLPFVRSRPAGHWWWRLALVSALTISGFFVLVYVAATRLPSGVAAVLMASSALATLALARLLVGERATWWAWLGAGIGLVGVVLLVGAAPTALDPVGVGASLLAMLSASLGFVLIKRWRPAMAPLDVAAWQLVLGGAVLLPVALVVEGAPPALSPRVTAGFAYLVLVSTALAYVAWYYGLRHLTAGTVGIVGLLNPVSGAALGVLAAGERPSLGQVLGGALIIAGVALGVRRGSSATGSSSLQRVDHPGSGDAGRARGHDGAVVK